MIFIKDNFLNKIMEWIVTNYPDLTLEKNDEIKYGLDVLYMGLSKYLIIFTVVFVFGYLEEALFCSLFFGIIRATSFGLHAHNSVACLVISFAVIFAIPYLATIIYLLQYQKFIICTVLIFTFVKYAPADTEKHPIINTHIRFFLKIVSVSTSIIYSIIIITIESSISNILLLCMITECIIILPFTYKVFNEEYNNYLKYTKFKGGI